MKDVILYKIILGLYLLISYTTFAINPPVITATGNQTYCPGTSQKIIETISIINDPAEPSITSVSAQISSGYQNGQDVLSLINQSTLHSNILANWNPSEGKLTLTSTVLGGLIPYSDFESALKDVVFSNSSTSPSGTRTFSISLGTGQLSYLPSNGHYYEYVASLGINWTAARDAAASRTYYGLQGYLATLTSAEEAQLAGAQAPGTGWIGGSDAETEGTWKWVTGPEAGTTFWIGKNNGTTTAPFYYANWNAPNEPNDSKNNEDYAHITSPAVGHLGTWNDLPEPGDPITSPNYYPRGYIVEYGGMPGDPILQISASTTLTIAPTISSVTASSICGSGSLTLKATASNGSVYWYTAPTGGTSIYTGNSYTTPNLNSTTSYYVDATNGKCTTIPRKEIIATINPIPIITSTTPNSICGSGTVTLSAIASAGTINWYDTPTGGNLLGTGTSFTTPNITTTTTYYVDATLNGCVTNARTPIIATINTSPSITSTISAAICGPGTVTLGAVASSGIINWYDVPTGGTSLGTGNTFTTPSITITTDYYVEAIGPLCTTPTRSLITATVNSIPIITSTTPSSRCDSGTVTLSAIASIGTINWYDAPTGGNLLGTGNTFTTPSITTTTNYYVEAFASSCTTASRTVITASVYITPTITATSPGSRCDTGTVTLGANASAGTINWYDTAGNIIASGITFETPVLNKTTTYYVAAEASGCSSPKTAITATIYPIDNVNEEVLLCQGETTTLDASIPGMNYIWYPGGETTQTIVVSTTGDYNVTISPPMASSCDSKKNIKVIEHEKPIITIITVNENSIEIELANPENYYEFSVNGVDFQNSNHFSQIQSGQHTAYVREKNGCNLVMQNFTIFTIAKFFTPNNDGQNDLWEIKEMKDYPNSRVAIFNRYGKLLKQLNYRSLGWNGTYNGVDLPADDYWYVLKMEDSTPEIRGHFSLIR